MGLLLALIICMNCSWLPPDLRGLRPALRLLHRTSLSCRLLEAVAALGYPLGHWKSGAWRSRSCENSSEAISAEPDLLMAGVEQFGQAPPVAGPCRSPTHRATKWTPGLGLPGQRPEGQAWGGGALFSPAAVRTSEDDGPVSGKSFPFVVGPRGKAGPPTILIRPLGGILPSNTSRGVMRCGSRSLVVWV